MAALDFPDTPAVGQTYGSAGTIWRWDGTRWASTSGASGTRGRVAYAQVVTSQNSIPSLALTPLAGLSVSWVADPARTYRTTVYTMWLGGPSGVEVDLYAASRIQISATTVLHGSYGTTVPLIHVESGLSGTQTRSVLAQGLGNVCSLVATAVYPAFILVEDITYEAGSSAGTGEWRSFTPRLTAGTTNPNLGTAPNSVGRVSRFGNTVNWAVSITPGGTGVNAGSGAYLLDIPFPPHTVSGKFNIVGHGWIYGATGFKILTLDVTSVVTCRILKTDGAQLGEADGLTTAGSVLAVSGSYEAA